MSGGGDAADVEGAENRRDADPDADVAALARPNAERALEPGRKVRPGRGGRVPADRLGTRGGAGGNAGMPQRVAREHELPRAREHQEAKRKQRHELGRGLPSLAPSRPAKKARKRRRELGRSFAPSRTAKTARKRRHELGRGLPSLVVSHAAHVRSIAAHRVTDLRAFVTKVRQYDEYARQTL
jgi:hypothetical protein